MAIGMPRSSTPTTWLSCTTCPKWPRIDRRGSPDTWTNDCFDVTDLDRSDPHGPPTSPRSVRPPRGPHCVRLIHEILWPTVTGRHSESSDITHDKGSGPMWVAEHAEEAPWRT